MRLISLVNVALVLVAGCYWEERKSDNAVIDLGVTVTALLQNGDCTAAINLLEEKRQLSSEPTWHYLMADAQVDCYRRTRRAEFKEAALSTLHAAKIAFPNSSRALAWEGFFAESLGEHDLAKESNRAARKMATENIQKQSPTADDDRDVLAELDRSSRGH